MSFVRPEAQAALRRWRDALIAAGVALLGLYWLLTGFGILKWVGAVVLLIGLFFVVAGIQRARFATGRDGPGAVRVDEGQVAYFGPYTGGIVALSEMTRLELDPTKQPACWRLSQPGKDDLLIPLTSDGAEALFDIFATLPGLQTEKMLAQMRQSTDHPVVIWEKPLNRLH